MRRALVAVAAGCLLTGPTALAFFSGGFYPQPRLVAGLVVWSLVLALSLAGPAPVPHGTPGRITLAGLVGLSVWSALSISWAPLGGPAVASVQRLVLYLGAFLLAVGVLRAPRALRATEPVLALGTVVVVGYGLAGRVLPALLELDRSERAAGRLEQPITYWNAEGALAAVGLSLCARLAGDPSRPVWLRRLAAAATVPLSAAVYLSYSRGALAVAVAGLILLVALVPTRPQIRAAVTAGLTGVLAALASSAFAGVASLEGELEQRISDGAAAGVLLALLAAAVALLAAREDRDDSGAEGRLLPGGRGGVVGAVVLIAVVGLVAAGLGERPSAAELAAGADPQRLTTTTSNRYEYWRVGLRAFADHPLRGLGAGGFRVRWLQERSIGEAVRDVHSIELEQAAELGAVGLLAFLVMCTGGLLAARDALRRDPAAAAGAAAATLVWLLHASIDWDWQLPAVSLPAIVLTGALVVLGER